MLSEMCRKFGNTHNQKVRGYFDVRRYFQNCIFPNGFVNSQNIQRVLQPVVLLFVGVVGRISNAEF